ncbi:hypothetical protein PMI09_02310 [Rhizobium sp. CF122]|nr:hypothetical protein PMI09_02310 [Rhizobium sp. CF122]
MEILAARPMDTDKHLECMVKLQWAAYDSNGEELDDLRRLATHVHDLRESRKVVLA